MLKVLLRSGIAAGLVAGLGYLARRYYRSEFDHTLGRAKSLAKDVIDDITRKDKAVSDAVEGVSRKAV